MIKALKILTSIVLSIVIVLLVLFVILVLPILLGNFIFEKPDPLLYYLLFWFLFFIISVIGAVFTIIKDSIGL